jgi:hypothetical protein
MMLNIDFAFITNNILVRIISQVQPFSKWKSEFTYNNNHFFIINDSHYW